MDFPINWPDVVETLGRKLAAAEVELVVAQTALEGMAQRILTLEARIKELEASEIERSEEPDKSTL